MGVWLKDISANSQLSPCVTNLSPSPLTAVSILEISAPMIARGAQPYIAHVLGSGQYITITGAGAVLAFHKGQLPWSGIRTSLTMGPQPGSNRHLAATAPKL